MKKVLIIAPYFIPRRRVGALRPFKFVKYLEKFGWKPSVLSIDEGNSKITDLELKSLEGINTFKLKPPIDRTSTPQKKKRTFSKKKKENKFAKIVDDNFPIDTWLPFFWLKKKEINQIIKKVDPDIIWSTSDPWSGGYIAGKIAKKLNKKWVADFRDPWTLCNVRFLKKNKLAQLFEKRAERWVIENADYMTFTSKATERKYNNHYPSLSNKTETIYNSFDFDFETSSNLLPNNSNKLNILFLGTFRWLSDAKLIIDILERVKIRAPELFPNIELSSYGTLEGDDYLLAKEKRVLDVFKVRSKVPNEEVQNEISKSDILLLSTHSKRDDIVPAKLLDYLPSTKPIISIAQNKEVEKILTKTGRGVQFQEGEIQEASELIINCIQAKRDKKELILKLNPRSDEIQKFHAKYTTQQLAKILTNISESE
ncbi:MAG: glycosyltransferase family 4 protein [Balneolaceae bacterium]